MGRSKQPLQHEHVQGEQHQRTEIQEVLGDATRLDVGEVGEGLDVGSVRQPQGADHHPRTDQEDPAGQAGSPAPSPQLLVRIAFEL